MDYMWLGLLLLLPRGCLMLRVSVSGSPKATLGSSVSLTCTFCVDKFPVSLSMVSIVWTFGDRDILRYDNTLTSSRPGVTLDVPAIKEGVASLLIPKVTLSDEGPYTCLVMYNSEQQKREIMLQVQAIPVVKIRKEEETLRCLVTGFYPADIVVSWLRDGEHIIGSSNIEKSINSQRNADETYRVNNSITIMSQGQDEMTYSCRVEHKSLGEPFKKDLHLVYRDVDESKIPSFVRVARVPIWISVGMIVTGLGLLIWKKQPPHRLSPIHKLMSDDGEKVTLYCVASNCPKDPQVTWTVMEGSETKSKEKRKVIWKETENLEGKGSVPESSTTSGESDALLTEEYSMRTDRLEAGGLHNVLATLSFKPDAQKHENIEVSCRFVCGGKIKVRKLQYSYILRQPQVSQPIKLSINETGDVLCSLVLQEFYPKQIRIRWSCGVACYQDLESNTKIIPCSIKAFNAESECKIPGQLLKDPGFRVRVTWEHESRTGLEQQELSVRDKEFPWRPQMEEIINPDTLIHSKEGKFQCKIWGYFPDALEVKWLRREAGGQELVSVCPSEKYKIPEMEQKREADGTFSCTVSLIVSVSPTTDQGAEFICRVGHPSLGEPLERSTGTLSVRGAPVIRNITYEGTKIRAEIDEFYPQDIVVTWSWTKYIMDVAYREYESSRISNETHSNSDGTYRIISSCESNRNNQNQPSDKKHIKLHVTHEALGNPIEKMLIYEKGRYYEQQGDQNILLQKHPKTKQ
ncbi:uncharacterized protein LOC108703909 [Xenopus laevis]|uniref:Uncharacterized protein LOC108703909 n=1 Tax=Xenopus laevis TaxID=8355 RepID=A0A8J1LQL4_XENLA|nr:uncharacterized protein LOC108703909 [Xenopus laevis]XP_041431852.1 uncharacterized protein LOC108703909 [Xenopus laevis]XP_041431853.1 uncharacterized protein LOC108703909 [Xenopus laevis]